MAGIVQRLARCSRLPLHDRVDLGNRVLLPNGCDVEIDHRGRQVMSGLAEKVRGMYNVYF